MNSETGPLLQELERYYDAVPRPRCRTEDIGPFTLFVASAGWPYYARPRLKQPAAATPDDVQRVVSRQRELGVPLAIEWVHETTPGLAKVVEESGGSIEWCPLLVLDGAPHGYTGTARMLDAAEEGLIVAARAAISVGFKNLGTAAGSAGLDERDEAATGAHVVMTDAFRATLAAGHICMAAVFDPDDPGLGPIGGGSHLRMGDVAEIAGVGVLPVYRRRGLAAQLTFVLASDAHARGVKTAFCSAQSEDVARIYSRVGFRRVATACIAEFNNILDRH